jgi:very-short-patch-repair endonuclease
MTTLARRELHALANHDVIEGHVLRAHGQSREQLRTLLRREHLFRVHKDIYLTTDRPTDRGLWLAAALHCRGRVSFQPAGVLWQLLDEWDGIPHVTVAGHRVTKPPAGIRVHRSVVPDEGAVRDGIPVTSLFRTLDDLARHFSDAALRRAVGRAERHHALDLSALFDAARSRRLRRVLATYVAGRGLTDSELEALFFEIVARTSLPRPRMQRRKAGGRVDFIFEELKLIVEGDGYETHRGKVACQDDRTRDRANKRAGYDTFRFTWADVTLTPNEVAADLELVAQRLL